MERQCNEAEGARLLETMRKICHATGCEEVEHATLAYEESLQDVTRGATKYLDEKRTKLIKTRRDTPC